MNIDTSLVHCGKYTAAAICNLCCAKKAITAWRSANLNPAMVKRVIMLVFCKDICQCIAAVLVLVVAQTSVDCIGLFEPGGMLES